ncbi:hypothetical protein FHW67_004016 [Herbaspirillum sp. Sphag1AN]|uniref:hypothetical protein n=1 Tax=unclassified Herbaspirillum TaxID=2624150 RepID=UPI0016146514|nr:MULTISPECIES: hypothetical protein [unclassified Herbaspirillum]MBB3214694.1 hypothetical protein [Herbaspirillum sp. Sphag1AN]MBB3247903.1 hypothetical protein [Herbaspirillum sp. Sphag64]
MEISGTTVSPGAGSTDLNTAGSDSKVVAKPVADDSAKPQVQQDKVTISDAARNAQAHDEQKPQSPAAASKTASSQKPASTKDGYSKDGNVKDTGPKDTSANAKGFVYGALGLERPEKEAENIPPDGYTVGRWMAAAVTVGAIVSIIV